MHDGIAPHENAFFTLAHCGDGTWDGFGASPNFPGAFGGGRETKWGDGGRA